MFSGPDQLDAFLSHPTAPVVELFGRMDGDLAVLGAGGKMGVTLAMLAARAAREAGAGTRVVAVSRFSDRGARGALEAAGVHTVTCDLLDARQVGHLPDAANVVFMVGRKFGTSGAEPLTWAANTVAPARAAERYAGSRIVAFSTGCVYPLVSPGTGGCTEAEPPAPIGEYAQSCLGRERVFEHYSQSGGTPVCLLRLNYAIDLRYGVLHDLAVEVARGQPVSLSTPAFNCIWQGDANRWALLALDRCSSPATVLNITGGATHSTRDTATALGRAMGRDVVFSGDEGAAAYLSDASRAHRLFGSPQVAFDDMVGWSAAWVGAGKPSLGKPTHFEVTDGRF